MTAEQIAAVIEYLEDGFPEPAAVECQRDETLLDAVFIATLLNRSYELRLTADFLQEFSVPETIVAQLRELNVAGRMDRAESGRGTVVGATADSSHYHGPEDYPTTAQPRCPMNLEHRGVAPVSDRSGYNCECKECGRRFLLQR